MSLEQKLDTMAEALIDESMSPHTDLATKEKVEIFKAASMWHLGISKQRGKAEDDDATGDTFDKIRTMANGKGATQ